MVGYSIGGALFLLIMLPVILDWLNWMEKKKKKSPKRQLLELPKPNRDAVSWVMGQALSAAGEKVNDPAFREEFGKALEKALQLVGWTDGVKPEPGEKINWKDQLTPEYLAEQRRGRRVMVDSLSLTGVSDEFYRQAREVGHRIGQSQEARFWRFIAGSWPAEYAYLRELKEGEEFWWLGSRCKVVCPAAAVQYALEVPQAGVEREGKYGLLPGCVWVQRAKPGEAGGPEERVQKLHKALSEQFQKIGRLEAERRNLQEEMDSLRHQLRKRDAQSPQGEVYVPSATHLTKAHRQCVVDMIEGKGITIFGWREALEALLAAHDDLARNKNVLDLQVGQSYWVRVTPQGSFAMVLRGVDIDMPQPFGGPTRTGIKAEFTT